MQILKDEIRENILATATGLFYEFGFAGTPTRRIADAMNMSVSNMYKYFKNKEAIFAGIIDDYYINYRANFVKFISHANRDDFSVQSIEVLARALFDSIKVDHVKFVLLMDKSAGTRYEGFRDEVTELLEKHILRDAKELNAGDYVLKIIVRNFFSGIVSIAQNYQNDAWAYRNIGFLVRYHMNGMALLYK